MEVPARSRNSSSDTKRVTRTIGTQTDDIDYDSSEENSDSLRLYLAAKKGDCRSVRALIQSGEDPNRPTSDNLTPLYAAVNSKNVWIVQELVRAGADANFRKGRFSTPFTFAISEGTFEVVKILLDNGADIHTKLDHQRTALHVSALEGFVKISKLLIERGLDVDIRDEQNLTPLHVAAKVGQTETVRLLIGKGADVSGSCTLMKDEKDEFEFGSNLTPVVLASYNGHVDIVNILTQAGADVNVRTSENRTALHIASERGHLKLVDILLKAGAGSSINIKSSSDCTALLLAVKNGHIDIIKVLFKVEGIEFSPMTVTLETLLVTAARCGHLEIVKLLVAKGAQVSGRAVDMITPLYAALKHRKPDVVQFLIEQGADVLATDSANVTPLHDACEKNIPVKIIRCLVEKGANVDARSLKGATPLHHAAMGGNAEAVEFLVTKVSDIDPVCFHQTTPLYCAVKAGHLDVVQILLKRGANVNAQDESKHTPLLIALKEAQPEIAEFLVRHNASINLKEENESCTPLFLAVRNGYEKLVSLLLLRGADVNAANKFGVLPIHVAAKAGNVGMVNMLLTRGAYYNVKAKTDNYSGTALNFARSAGNVKVIIILEIIKKLFCAAMHNDTDQLVLCIEAGAVVNARRITGQTALHCVVNNYNCDAVKALLTGGADITLATDKGESPLQIAVANSCIKIPEILLAHARSLGFVKYNSVVNARTKEGGDTVLHTAAEINKLHIVKFLLASGAVYNAKNNSGKTPIELTTNEAIKSLLLAAEKLFEAVKKGDCFKVVKQILEVNASVINAREVNIGGTPLCWSLLKGHTVIAQELLSSGADCCLVTNNGVTPLHIAASEGNIEIIDLLINGIKTTDVGKVNNFVNARTKNGTVALHVALSSDVVKCLLQAGATYDIRNGEGKAAVDLTKDDDIRSLLKTTHQIFEDVKNRDVMVMSTLNSLEAGEFKAITSTRNIHGQSLVQVAMTNGRFDVASKVLKKLK